MNMLNRGVLERGKKRKGVGSVYEWYKYVNLRLPYRIDVVNIYDPEKGSY